MIITYCRDLKTWVSFIQGCFVPSLIKIGLLVMAEKIFKFHQSVLLFWYYLSLKNGISLHLNKLKMPLTQGCLVQSLFEIGPMVLQQKIFIKFHECIFSISLSSPICKFRNICSSVKGVFLVPTHSHRWVQSLHPT